MADLNISPKRDRFWTPLVGIGRHDMLSRRMTGRYEVVALFDTHDALNFFCGKGKWTHAAAVVDDFGDLVRVGNWL